MRRLKKRAPPLAAPPATGQPHEQPREQRREQPREQRGKRRVEGHCNEEESKGNGEDEGERESEEEEEGAGSMAALFSRMDATESVGGGANAGDATLDEGRRAWCAREGHHEYEEQVVVYPWIDGRGELDAACLQGFVRRVTALVAQHPGIPEVRRRGGQEARWEEGSWDGRWMQ